MTDRERHHRIADLFAVAKRFEGEEREAYLSRECRDDVALRADVESLLNLRSGSEGFLETPAAVLAQPEERVETLGTPPPPSDRLGRGGESRADDNGVPRRASSRRRAIGPYRILEKIGEGGLGSVYLATEPDSAARRVAVKVIKHGVDTREALARFAQEHHALTLMNHPAISRVYRAGVSSDERPYFAMEYVPGVPITDYCDRERLSTVERLRLVQAVCLGVHHAHQKAIIHRDLKPANILVMTVDGKPQPKIIDFGVAKAGAQRLSDSTLYTRVGSIIGTPEYMAPEQAELSAVDIDTRADVYSLGVLLYQILVGKLPFDFSSRRDLDYLEMRRIIREEEPMRPSARLSTLGHDSKQIAELQASDTRSLVSHLRGDLDWIIMKALEKERARRYASATELADDIGRYLANEPIVARPPSTLYRVRKFVRRYRVRVASSAVFLVLLSATTLWALSERDRANDEAAQKEQAYQDLDVRKKAADAVFSDLFLAEGLAAQWGELWPAYPSRVGDMESWVTDSRELVSRLPSYLTELERLRGTGERKQVGSEEFGEERDAARYLESRLKYLDAIIAVLEGAPLPEVRSLAASERKLGPGELSRLVVERVFPERTLFGEELTGLVLARQVVRLLPEKREPLVQLARAAIANGFFEEARQSLAGAEALQRRDPLPLPHWEDRRDRLLARIDWFESDESLPQLHGERDAARAELAELQWAADSAGWEFDDVESALRHQSLCEVIRRLESFRRDDGLIERMEQRLERARTLRARTLAATDPSWDEAIAAIAASPSYGGLRITPQLGLAPLGEDPDTELWEFWVIDSGERPRPARRYEPLDSKAASRYEIESGTAIVLVLMPGGFQQLGSEAVPDGLRGYREGSSYLVKGVLPNSSAERAGVRAGDIVLSVNGEPFTNDFSSYLQTIQVGQPTVFQVSRNDQLLELRDESVLVGLGSPYVDPWRDQDERLSEVQIEPFFMSKYELTQGQWLRSSAENPQPSRWRGGTRAGYDLRHPVERVSWDEAHRVVRDYGLDLPTEAQWEYSCRLGSGTVYHCGDLVEELHRYAAYSHPDITRVHHVPVAWHLPNKAGLHGMLGNNWEWCADSYLERPPRPRPGDGLTRDDYRLPLRARRGGSHRTTAVELRSANRDGAPPDSRDDDLGVRPCRALEL